MDQGMLKKLQQLHQTSPHLLENHADFPSLIISHFGAEGLAYLRENGYHSLFSAVAHHAILDFIASDEWGPLSYPVGGMSQFVTRMLRNATALGMRIFHNEPVNKINTETSEKFAIETATLSINAEKVLCSIDPLGFAGVTGNIAETVKGSPAFRAIAPKTSVTVAAWWSDRWWERSSLHGGRNLSRVTSHGDCFNGMEIATYPYGRMQNVTRVVYDDGACVHMWRTIIDSNDSERLINEVVGSLQQVFIDVLVPRPRTVKGTPLHE